MRFLLPLLVFSLFSLSVTAKEIRDLSFEIHNEKIKSIVETKGTLAKLDKLYCKVFWIKDKLAVEVIGKVDKDISKIVLENCKRSGRFVVPMPLKEYLSPFKKVETKGGWDVYRDDTGVNQINEVLVKKSKNQTRIIEKRPTGTTKLKYIYKKFKGTKVLAQVEMSSYEGIQNVKTQTDLKYEKVSGHVLPVKATIDTTQNLVRKEVGDFTRKLIETVEFRNYSVNDSKALIYFNKN